MEFVVAKAADDGLLQGRIEQDEYVREEIRIEGAAERNDVVRVHFRQNKSRLIGFFHRCGSLCIVLFRKELFDLFIHSFHLHAK